MKSYVGSRNTCGEDSAFRWLAIRYMFIDYDPPRSLTPLPSGWKQDLWTRSNEDFPLKLSAITRICKMKSGTGLMEYLVKFSAVSLISTVKNSFGSTSEDLTTANSSAWIPAPILSCCLPQMIAEHQHVSCKSHARASAFSSTSDSEHVSMSFHNVSKCSPIRDLHYTSSVTLGITTDSESSVSNRPYHVGFRLWWYVHPFALLSSWSDILYFQRPCHLVAKQLLISQYHSLMYNNIIHEC